MKNKIRTKGALQPNPVKYLARRKVKNTSTNTKVNYKKVA